VIQEADFDYFKLGIIPSVQPTHDFIYGQVKGRKRAFENAYAYKKL
jgi:hypothetical protein